MLRIVHRFDELFLVSRRLLVDERIDVIQLCNTLTHFIQSSGYLSVLVTIVFGKCVYIVTRPLGTSVTDWGSVPHGDGGLGLGKGPVAILLTILIVIF